MNWRYFSDDEDIKEAIYHDAIEGIVAAGPARDSSALRQNLTAMHPNFFRNNDHKCVRFMPKYGQYSFIRVFCKKLADGTVEISHY